VRVHELEIASRDRRPVPSCRGQAGAYVDADDVYHVACLELLETHPGPLVLPTLVVTEVAYLLASRLGWQAEVRFLGDLAGGDFALEPLHASDAVRIAELVARYRDLPLGTVDASIVAAAERLDIGKIATVDRRHFSVVRPVHAPAFELLCPNEETAREELAQDHGYGLCDTGCRSPVAKRSKRKGCRSEECSPPSTRAISRPTAIIL